jgi:hypothetical protein
MMTAVTTIAQPEAESQLDRPDPLTAVEDQQFATESKQQCLSPKAKEPKKENQVKGVDGVQYHDRSS